MRTPIALGVAALLALPPAGLAEEAASPSRAGVDLPGRVVLDSFSSKIGMPAVTFDHLSHRVRHTCRACHADLGFAMKAGETQVSAATNEEGSHCGACHDGKARSDGKTIFGSCSGWPRADPARGCTRCHTGADHGAGPALEQLRATLPLDAAGDIDWGAAQRRGLVKPLDFVEGVSVKRPSMRIDRDVTIQAFGTWLENVTFSHKKHATWNGCELCHPDIFPVTRRSAAKYTMSDIRAGRYCGVCHVNVAFSIGTCQRCHPRDGRRMVP